MYEAKCLVMDYQQPNSVHQQHLHQLHSFAPAAAAAAATDVSSRWSQYQQLWRQHQMFINGKSCGKDSPEKKDDTDLLWSNVEAQAAFLSPNIWDNKNLPYDADLKYCDLDEFLSDNGIPLESQPAVGGAMVPTQQAKLESACLSPCAVTQPQQPPPQPQPQPQQPQPPKTNGIIPKREPSPSPSEPLSPLGINPPSPADSTLSFASSSRDFDPRSRPFSDEELKPQPMVKKSRKQFVPDGLKDEKYWARRRKNNMAAKRSRDARRLKENQIALRAGFLEKENMGLRQEMERLKRENLALRDRLSKFTDV